MSTRDRRVVTIALAGGIGEAFLAGSASTTDSLITPVIVFLVALTAVACGFLAGRVAA